MPQNISLEPSVPFLQLSLIFFRPDVRSMLTKTGFAPLFVEKNILRADIPALLGLNEMDRENFTLYTVSSQNVKEVQHTSLDGHECFVDDWYIQMIRSRSLHFYAIMNLIQSMNFRRDQLSRLYRKFFQPSSTNLFDLRKRARTKEATPETLQTLKDMQKRCDTF